MRREIILLLVVIALVLVDARRGKGRSQRRHHKSNHKSHRKLQHKSAHGFLRQEFSHKVTETVTKFVSENVNIIQNYQKEVQCSGHCLPLCAYWKQDHCECKAGLAGVGDLCCTDPKEYGYNCVVRGDPYLTSSLGQKAQIFNPCGQVLSVIAARTTSGYESCRVTVRTADVIESGVFITNQVELTYEIGSQQKEYVFLNGKEFYHTNQMNSASNINWQGLDSRDLGCVTLEKEKIYISQDKCRKVWTVKACGTVINFRRDVDGGKPGVCINSKYTNSDQPGDAQCVCNLLPHHDIGQYHSKAAFYLAKSFENKEYLNLKLGCYTDTCREITNTFDKCSVDRRPKAMKACAPILEVTFRACAFMFGGIDGKQLFNIFYECVDAFCGENQKWCMDVKMTTAMLKCPIHHMNCYDFKKGKPNPDQHLLQQIMSP